MIYDDNTHWNALLESVKRVHWYIGIFKYVLYNLQSNLGFEYVLGYHKNALCWFYPSVYMQLKCLERSAGGRPERQPAWETVNRSREGYIRPLMPVCARKLWTLNPLNLTSTAVLCLYMCTYIYWTHMHICKQAKTQTVLHISDIYMVVTNWLRYLYCILSPSSQIQWWLKEQRVQLTVFLVALPAVVARFISVGCRCEINVNVRHTNKRNMFCFFRTPQPFH